MPNKKPKNNSSKTKAVKSAPKRDKEYYNAILLEEIRGQMKTVIDGVENLRVSMGNQFAELRKEMNDRFELVEAAIRHNSQDINGLKTDVQVLKTDVQVLKTDVQVLKTDVQGLKTDVQGLKTDVKEIRVEMRQMENRLSDKIDRIGNRVDNHEVRMTNLETARL